eukprot:CAMPEP_0172442238 /NCGR_PEP_ID=MMETSP1065-20121228/2715_1 /TAXON_ID=265537 /ORGANISM="Amphiprora paludosa, Strain CCMP125" /LENGTH=270 /DNA_ID=CAMNT_0013192027 /DNA_START=109 /DNA_END=921 /DNA_ORIENTATION=-
MANDEVTEEWVLYTHKCSRHMSKAEWEQTTHESSHFFSHPPRPPTSMENDKNNTNSPEQQSSGNANKPQADQEPFRCDLSHLPLPSRNFFLKGQHCAAPPQHVEYSVFKKGVFPEWEDENCQGEWFVKHYFPPKVLDDYWFSLVKGIMSGKIDSRYVAGIRVVDKSHSKHPLYRLELWLNTTVQKTRDQVRDQAMSCLTMDPHYAFKFHWRKFELETSNSSSSSSVVSSVVSSVAPGGEIGKEQPTAQAQPSLVDMMAQQAVVTDEATPQ